MKRQRPKTWVLRQGKGYANLGTENLPQVPCCLIRGELEVAKNLVEQEEHHAHGPRPLIAKSLHRLKSPLCAFWATLHSRWGQPPGLLQGLSPMEEKCLYPQHRERCYDVLASVVWHK